MGVYPKEGFQTATFRGLLVSAYDKTTGAPVGTMRQTASTMATSKPSNPDIKLACDSSSFTHNSRLDQSELYFEWMAPATFTQSSVELRYVDIKNVQQSHIFYCIASGQKLVSDF